MSLPPSALPRPGVLMRIGSFLWHFLRSLRHWNHFKPRRVPEKCILFSFASRNQKSSLSPIVERMNGSLFVGLDFLGRLDLHDSERFPSTYAYLLSCFFFPLVLFKFWKARGYQKESFRFAFDSYWRAYGCYLFSRLWLRQVAPAGVVVANDHIVMTRALTQAARRERIPTFYVQHASVTAKFPALSFDYALLEGIDALRKYELAGASRTKVFLVGMPKVDTYFQHLNINSAARSIGLCTSTLAPLPRVEQLCEQLRREFPALPFFLRPHPGDRRDAIWTGLAKKYGMELSDSKTELSFEFLKRVDVVIAGESNIHLETALMNVFPVYYDFTQAHMDWYGFQRNGLVEYASEPQEVCCRLRALTQNKPPVRMKTKPYCATVDTRYDGRSSELASALIQELASGQVNLEGWRRVPNVQLEAYEFVDNVG